jgi:uncharacterized repeat protein (TIGR03803 family)
VEDDVYGRHNPACKGSQESVNRSTFKSQVIAICAVASVAGCSGSQPSLSVSPQGLLSQQSLAEHAYHIIHPFGRSPGDGQHPWTDLIDVKGTLYGTTATGGSYGGYGTVFSITPSGQETVLFSFAGPDGNGPLARLLNVNGTLYGTTIYGGKTNGAGTVFRVTLSGGEKVLHSFNYAGLGGSQPLAGLINVNGTLYGTTSGNDDYYGYGNVFSITTTGKYKVLHRFDSTDGANPKAALLDVDGTLYGTTASGGEYDGGTVFSITTAGDERVLHSFGGSGGNDGANPSATLIDVRGTLYGTTADGGNSGDGTVFSITTDGAEKVLHSFSGSDGSKPVAALKNVQGVLYGTTEVGGSKNLGTVFKITKSGKETTVHSFSRGDGVNPVAGVIAVDGTLYGTTLGSGTSSYGSHSYGNVYSLTP